MSLLSSLSESELEKYLVEDKIVSVDQLNKVKEKSKKNNTSIVSVLVQDHYITNEQLTKYIAKINHLPYVNLSNATINPKVLDVISKNLAEHYMAVPIGTTNGKLAVAMLEADNIQAIDFLTNKINRPMQVYLASEEGIRNVLRQYKVDIDQNDLSRLNQQNSSSKTDNTSTSLQATVQDSPISKILSSILEYSVNNRASDIHIEPTENNLRIRVRIDGILRELMKLPKETEPSLISRIKILSNLKIDEHRIPQDGEFSIQVGSNKVDLRVAISPIIWGEQVVIRLLDKNGTSLNLVDLGYYGRTLNVVRKNIKSSSGMILTSGPTGSGKSTSLYALLSEVKDDSVNIVTMEDPVEYKMSGINQIQVNYDVGLNFSAGLRSILRQDPDIIMVGEIRDHETAELAIQAALTGHLVFSTLHTNSASGILPRLLDMGVEPFLIASTIKVVIGQRLIRKVAEKNESYESNQVETTAINQTIGNILPHRAEDVEAVSKDLGYENLPIYNQKAYTLKRGLNVPGSPGGFKGRLGIYEAFEVTGSIQDLILKKSSSAEIQKQAQEEGMITMRQDGYLKAIKGLTTINEVDRVASFGGEV